MTVNDCFLGGVIIALLTFRGAAIPNIDLLTALTFKYSPTEKELNKDRQRCKNINEGVIKLGSKKYLKGRFIIENQCGQPIDEIDGCREGII